MAFLKLAIQERLDDIRQGINRIRPSKFGAVYFWQEVSSYADKQCKVAWEKLREDGIVISDDEMRAKGEGDHIITEDRRFSVVAKVSKPRETFDKDVFIGMIAAKYKLKVHALEEMAERAKKEGNPSLTKRVLEAAS